MQPCEAGSRGGCYKILHFLCSPAEVPDETPDALERLAMTFGGHQTRRAESIRTARSFVQSGLPLEEVYAVAAVVVRGHTTHTSLVTAVGHPGDRAKLGH